MGTGNGNGTENYGQLEKAIVRATRKGRAFKLFDLITKVSQDPKFETSATAGTHSFETMVRIKVARMNSIKKTGFATYVRT